MYSSDQPPTYDSPTGYAAESVSPLCLLRLSMLLIR